MQLRTQGSADITAVDQWLDEFFRERLTAAASHGERYLRLWQELRHAARGGKRVRPALLLDSYRLLGGDPSRLSSAAIPVAGALELMHTAFLLHDDVIDRDRVRRGTPNLYGSFAASVEARLGSSTALRWGEAAAVLGGDLMLHEAQLALFTAKLEDPPRAELMALMRDCLLITAAGELDDVAFELGVAAADLPEILQMYYRKTAFYTFEAPLRAAAILAQAPPAIHAGLAEYGRRAGIAFQLRDDVLGTFGDPSLTGKSALTDLRSGKLTPLAWIARQRCADHPELNGFESTGNLDDAAAAQLRSMISSSGALEDVKAMIEQESHRAVAALSIWPIPDELRQHLEAVADQARERVR
ncbi:polyprenyl synthetase family protein [Acaricomes phytoseiuli]|uniref:polyprenyl synthetase family protein n=1 Tax=Acaricomes phytoseiuli TaxID=291968 RepID=UPI000371F623|nr:polyprenyl synthetase family protein [Acaricomes phytoseiuli]MCW1248673.1 polyprenyl synthetase family protein [Acaricomes phytoseiuli]